MLEDRSWRLPWPSRIDVAFAVGVGVLLECELWFGEQYQGAPAFPGSRALTAPFLVVLAVGLAWRHAKPLPAFLVVMAALVALSLAEGGGEAGGLFLVLLVMCYSAVAFGTHPAVVGVAAVTTIAIHDLRDPYLHTVGDRIFTSIFLVAGFGLGLVMRHRVRRNETLAHEAQQLRTTADDQARQAVTAERARIARELHDVVAHSVSVMVLQAQVARTLADGERDAALGVIETTGRQAMNEMRRLVHVLREDDAVPHAPQPGLRQLDTLVEESRATGVEAELAVHGDTNRVPPGVGLAVFRIVQEALTNVRKHAGTTCAWVDVDCTGPVVNVRVRNRAGSSAALTSTGSGHGLVGMHERVSLYGGQLHTGPCPTGGYLVDATLPIQST